MNTQVQSVLDRFDAAYRGCLTELSDLASQMLASSNPQESAGVLETLKAAIHEHGHFKEVINGIAASITPMTPAVAGGGTPTSGRKGGQVTAPESEANTTARRTRGPNKPKTNGMESGTTTPSRRGRRSAAASGTYTPISGYAPFLFQAFNEMGKGHRFADIQKKMYSLMEAQQVLKPADQEKVGSNQNRWSAQSGSLRQQWVKKNYIAKDEKGNWALTPEGKKAFKALAQNNIGTSSGTSAAA